jgi:Carboxypeptidase regulatory-like domain
MCRLLSAFGLLLLALSLAAQDAATSAPGTANKPVESCTVSGRVVSASDGTPVKSALVGLVKEGSKSRQKFGDYTDAEGKFEIKGIAPGRYRFSASHTGYLSQQFQSKDVAKPGAMLTLTAGQEVTGVLFRLTRAAVVTGRIVDANGEPMVGVSVSVLRKPTADEMEDGPASSRKPEVISESAAPTDDRGEYRIFGLRPGDYYIKANSIANELLSLQQAGRDPDGLAARSGQPLRADVLPRSCPVRTGSSCDASRGRRIPGRFLNGQGENSDRFRTRNWA